MSTEEDIDDSYAMREALMEKFDSFFQLSKQPDSWFDWINEVEDVFVEMQARKMLLTSTSELWFRKVKNMLFQYPETANWIDAYLLVKHKTIQSDTVDFGEFATAFRMRFPPHIGSFPTYADGEEAASGDASESDVSDASISGRDLRGRTTGSRRGSGGKRAWTQRDSVSNPPVTCEACGYFGHLLENCWVVFPEKRPERTFISEARVRLVKGQIEGDEDLRTKIYRLQNKKKNRIQRGRRKASSIR